MNKIEAEAEICLLVKDVDAIRASNRTDEEKVEAIASVDATIKELKKITGPRHHVGVFRS